MRAPSLAPSITEVGCIVVGCDISSTSIGVSVVLSQEIALQLCHVHVQTP